MAVTVVLVAVTMVLITVAVVSRQSRRLFRWTLRGVQILVDVTRAARVVRIVKAGVLPEIVLSRIVRFRIVLCETIRVVQVVEFALIELTARLTVELAARLTTELTTRMTAELTAGRFVEISSKRISNTFPAAFTSAVSVAIPRTIAGARSRALFRLGVLEHGQLVVVLELVQNVVVHLMRRSIQLIARRIFLLRTEFDQIVRRSAVEPRHGGRQFGRFMCR